MQNSNNRLQKLIPVKYFLVLVPIWATAGIIWNGRCSSLSQKMELVVGFPVYDTAPMGNTLQARFLNMVCEASNYPETDELLTFVKEIERTMGRQPGPPNSPRPIDIDILFYGDQIINTPELIIPHPRLTERAFVLVPLAEIAPDFVHPVAEKRIKQMLKALKIRTDDVVKWENIRGETMYEITVEMDFDAAHALRGYQGKCETLHGHRFKVVATVKGNKLDEIGLAYDFTLLKKHLGEILAKYDHTNLNEVPPFNRINPSSENIAATIYKELKKKLTGAPVSLDNIEVWESPQSRVTYRPD